MELTDSQKLLYDQVNIQCMELSKKNDITEDMIITLVNYLSNSPFSKVSLSEEEKREVAKYYFAHHRTSMEVGIVLKEKDHNPWYMSAKAGKPATYWNRYCQYLLTDKEFSDNVLNALDANTDEIMDLLGNPDSNEGFSRKGLVVGDVQSGKTATYIGLMNKAADAGYRIIILLTGVIEKLRAQTQERVDEGFVGVDSDASVMNENTDWVGVGRYDSSQQGWCFTSKKKDFNLQTASTRGRLKDIHAPVVFVLKKNKSVLNLLYTWLSQNNLEDSGKISLPMLMIDDEADNASINTKSDPTETTVINGCIRDLLNLFSKSNYVGYTATPYANIFIDPDTDDQMRKEDLFPKHFIFVLSSPSNYIGPLGVFGGRPSDFDTEDDAPDLVRGKYSFMLHENDDCESEIPLAHKKDFQIESLPESLKRAIGSFLIANAIRDLRGDITSHRTMLVNVSRFIIIQNQLKDMIDSYLRGIRRIVENYSKLEPEDACCHQELAFLRDVFELYYSGLTEDVSAGRKRYEWRDIQFALKDSISPIVVRTVNGGNAVKNLDYDKHKEDGLRLIAVGGYSLSRGLTLEGLIISYYYRNSKMYDTLMQMGRWFGYRDGYSDLCQIFMSRESQDWYSYIANATEELKKSLRLMRDLDKTPEDFGLKVRSDHVGILVTAKNKMRSAGDHSILISISKAVVETKYIFTRKDISDKNFTLVDSWLEELLAKGHSFWDVANRSLNSNYQLKNIDYKEICRFLSKFEESHLNTDFVPETLVKLIEKSKHLTPVWDVLIASGKGKTIKVGGTDVKRVTRSFVEKKKTEVAQISGASAHLGSRNVYKCGLTESEYQAIKKKVESIREPKDNETAITLNQEEFFIKTDMPRRNPVLVIWPLELDKIARESGASIPGYIANYNMGEKAFVGLSLGYPEIDEAEEIKAEYKANKRFIESLDSDEEVDFFDEETGLEES